MRTVFECLTLQQVTPANMKRDGTISGYMYLSTHLFKVEQGI